MPIEYYIGIAVGLFSVLLAYVAYVISKLIRGNSMCDRCKYMTFKDWKGKRRCADLWKWFYITPKYCSHYKEKEDEHGSN